MTCAYAPHSARCTPSTVCLHHLKAPGQRGFTLAEALIAVVILALLGGLTFGTFARAMSARDRATEITDRYHSVRQAMSRMAREISMAFLSQNRDCGEPRTRTIFLGKRANSGTRLDFTSFSHYKMRADAKESDQNELSYYVEHDPDHSDVKNLMRREQNRIDEKPEEGGTAQILAENVEELSFSFYDTKSDQWEDDWDNTAQDTRDRLPKYVKIKLVVKDHRGKPLAFETKTRIFVLKANYIPGFLQIPCPQ
jgi:general secretion pathway protein J